MTEPLRFETSDGLPTEGALAVPAGTDAAGAFVVVHEWWGLNDDIRSICDRFAEAGYLALGIDVYGGRVATTAAEAMVLVDEMKTADAMKVVAGAVRVLREHSRSNGKVGATGFCLGGGLAVAGACTVEGIACAVPFYGLPIASFQVFGPNTPPILGHYAEVDPHIGPERVKALQEKAIAAGASFEAHFYEGPHAFMRRADPKVYHPASEALAWSRTMAFAERWLR